MTTIISADSRPGWSQRMPAELHSDAVGARMQRIACREAERLPGREIIVRATRTPPGESPTEGDLSIPWRILHWPADELSWWELR